MKKVWSLLHHRIVWTIGGALLAIVAVPAIVGLVLKALGLVHGTSLHTWLHDAGNNVDGGGAAGSAGAGAAGSSGAGTGGPDPTVSDLERKLNDLLNKRDDPQPVSQGSGGGTGSPGQGGGGSGGSGEGGGGNVGADSIWHTFVHSVLEFAGYAAGEGGDLIPAAGVLYAGKEQLEKGMQIEADSGSMASGTTQSAQAINLNECSDGTLPTVGGTACPN
jgi:hypothetical protein